MVKSEIDQKLDICLADMKLCDEIGVALVDDQIKIRNMENYNDVLKQQHDRRVQEEASNLLNQMLNGNGMPSETEGAGSLVYRSNWYCFFSLHII